MFFTCAMYINLKLLFIVSTILIIIPGIVNSQIQGPNSPGNGTNINVTGVSWTNPNNVTASDDNKASVTLSTFFGLSDALVATNFGFSIPLTATIDSIGVSIEKSSSGGFAIVSDLTLQLTKDGTNGVGTNLAQFGNWSTSDTYTQYGDTTWGTTWTPAEINSNNFGVYFRSFIIGFGSITAYVDHVTVSIFYSLPTPVNLISFDGKVIKDVIELKWQTSWEKNNDFYTLEKSSDGLNYMELAMIDGKGTIELTSDYTYIDPLPFQGNNYYRLTQSDFDGTCEVFKPTMVQYIEKGSLMKIYPNPVTGQYVNININPDLLKGENNQTYILVRNITGELVYQQIIPTNTLGNKISLNRRFETGVYILELHSPYGESAQKLIVN